VNGCCVPLPGVAAGPLALLLWGKAGRWSLHIRLIKLVVQQTSCLAAHLPADGSPLERLTVSTVRLGSPQSLRNIQDSAAACNSWGSWRRLNRTVLGPRMHELEALRGVQNPDLTAAISPDRSRSRSCSVFCAIARDRGP